MNSKKILFVINGLGLGNSTRCHAVIQELATLGIRVEVITSGNGLWYLAQQPEVDQVHEMESLRYESDSQGLSAVRTALVLPRLVATLLRKRAQLARLVDDLKPGAIVIDSEYAFRESHFHGVPVVAINNSDVVWHAYHQFSDRPREIMAQFRLVEQMDYLYHRLVPSLVLSPALPVEVAQSGGHFARVGPMVRRKYRPSLTQGPVERVVIMLSGSVFGSQVRLSQTSYPFGVDVLGRGPSPDQQSGPQVQFHGKVLETLPFLEQADLVVINGGFSAVSEAFFMQKPMVVIPVPRHAEQWVNGRLIEEMGVGFMAREEDLESAMLAAVERIESLRQGYRRLPPTVNGAQLAAARIASLG